MAFHFTIPNQRRLPETSRLPVTLELAPPACVFGGLAVVLFNRLQPIAQFLEVHRAQLGYSESEVDQGCEGACGGP